LVDLAEGKGGNYHSRNQDKKIPGIYAVSDSIGETAESVVKATTSQFVDQEFNVYSVFLM
jgi:hypothetical protein